MKRFFNLFIFLTVTAFLISGCTRNIRRYSKLDTPEVNFRAGQYFLSKGELKNAKIKFERSLKLDKHFAPAYWGLGEIYYAKKKYRKALAEYKKSISLDKSYTESYMSLAKTYSDIGKSKKSIKVLEKYLKKINPHASRVIKTLSYCYILNDQPDKAKKLVDTAIEKQYDRYLDEAYNFINSYILLKNTLPAHLLNILNQNYVTRSEFAVLLNYYFELQYKKLEISDVSIADVNSDWAIFYIKNSVNLNLMLLAPGNKFFPEEYLSRQDLALALYRLVKIETGNTDKINNLAIFKDVARNSLYVDAVNFITANNIVEPVSINKFGFNKKARVIDILSSFYKTSLQLRKNNDKQS